MKINNYAIARARDSRNLEEKVVLLVENGWTPIGGIAIGAWSGGIGEYAQALVFYEKQ